MAGMKMAALAAGFGAALAGGAQEANAQATELVMPLDSGEMIVINVADVPRLTQEKIFEALGNCYAEESKTRDECVVGAATEIAMARLDAVVKEAHEQIAPLEGEIGLTPAELFQEPAFCSLALEEANAEQCTTHVGEVQLAAAEFGFAEARERLIAAETREAKLDVAIESSQESVEDKRDRNKETEQELAVANAVLAALQRVTQ